MNNKIGRFSVLVKKERTRDFFALLFYISYIGINMDLRLEVENIFSIILIIIGITVFPIYWIEYLDKLFNRNRENSGKNITKKIKKILKEILMFIPIELLSLYHTFFIMVGQPVNQTKINETFYDAPIFNTINIIIIAPIIEEIIFRFLPYRFIKNKTLYIVGSSIIFAAIHVVNDPNSFYYVWFYMMRSIYYGYRYHKTKDLLVSISIHSFNNLIATLILIFSQ